MYMDAFLFREKNATDGSRSVLASSQSSGDPNGEHGAFNCSQVCVCRHPFMAGIGHKYFLQIFILYCIARDVRRAHSSRSPRCLSGGLTAAAASAAARVSVFREPPSGFAPLQRRRRNSLKVIFLICGSAAETRG